MLDACSLIFIHTLTLQAPAAPLSSGSFRDDTLIVARYNFSVVAPSGWRWAQQSVDLQQGKVEVFTATSSTGDSVIALLAFDVALWGTEDARFARGLLKGMQDKLPVGWTIRDVALSPSPVSGFARALRLRAILKDPTGTNVYRFGYLLPGKKSYFLLANTLEDTEPGLLRSMVATFRLIDPRRASVRLPAAVALGNPRLLFIGLFALFVVRELVARSRARSGSPVGASGMTFLSRLLMLVGISAAFALTLVDVRVSDTVGVQAEATGAVIGVVAMASGIAYLAYGRRSKRRWNSFARLFCGLCLFLPLLASIGGAAP